MAGRKKRKSSVLLEIVGFGGSILHNLVMVLAVFGASDGRCWIGRDAEQAMGGEGWDWGIGGAFRARIFSAQVYYSWDRPSGIWPRCTDAPSACKRVR